jgi:hypothetical protein
MSGTNVIVDARDGIYDLLTATYLTEYSGCDVVALNCPNWDVDTLDVSTTTIAVVPMAREISALGMNPAGSQRLRIDVAILKKLSPSDESDGAVDDLWALVDAVIDLLNAHEFTTNGQRYVISGIENEPLLSADEYKNHSLFLSIVSCYLKI